MLALFTGESRMRMVFASPIDRAAVKSLPGIHGMFPGIF